MGTEDILVTSFRKHASPGYNEYYKKNCPVPPYHMDYQRNIEMIIKNLLRQWTGIFQCFEDLYRRAHPEQSMFKNLV